MQYLITCDDQGPFMTQWFEAENHFNAEINMVVYDLINLKYTTNGFTWLDIEEDHL